MPFARRSGLGQNGACLMSEGSDQMDTRHFLPMNAPQRLPIDGDGFIHLKALGRKPLAQDTLKGRVVQMPKHAMDGGSAGTTLSLEAQRRSNLRSAVLAPLTHRLLAACSTHQGTAG